MMLRLAEITQHAIQPALDLLPPNMSTPEARLMLLAIGLQESRFEHRWQIVDAARPEKKGPARGFWQFERGSASLGGGVWGVFRHSSSHELLRQLCHERDVSFDPPEVWAALERDDVLAAGLARLLLWTDRRRLPPAGDADAAWDCYERNWRPGKPHPETWPRNYRAAMDEVFPPAPKKGPAQPVTEDDL